MRDVMISLIGEQPIPNLLPIRQDRPGKVLLAYTERTREVCDRLERILRRGGIEVHLLLVLPAHIVQTREALKREILEKRQWDPNRLTFNLTGGTKAMALAAYQLAEAWRCPFIYVESDERESRMLRYEFNRDGALASHTEDALGGVITLDDYLTAYLGTYTPNGFASNEGGKFERAVYDALRPEVDDEDIKAGVHHAGVVDIDLAFRYQNQVGVAEVKLGGLKLDHLEHITTIGQALLGTYTRKFIITGASADDRPDLKKLAQSLEITVIELPGYNRQSGSLVDADRRRLAQTVRERLGG